MIEEPCSVADILKAPIIVPPGKKSIRLLACGVEQGVESIVHQLHVLHFASVGEWSKPLRSLVPGEVIRILTRHIIISN